MQDNKYRKFYVDWWNIRRSTIYLLIALILLGAGIIWGVSYASRNNWFVPDEHANVPKDAARIVSFEGDVRITRAATRDTTSHDTRTATYWCSAPRPGACPTTCLRSARPGAAC